jgi:hypothetical protein
MKTTWIYVAGLLSLLASSSSQAAGLFDSDSILEITLRGPVSALVGDRENRRERSFSLEMDGGTVPVALRVRGKSRVELCSFPPLRLNFTPDSASGTPFAGQDKLKLVTHCKGSTEYEQNVLEEFLTYRLLNVLTDISVRTRLLRVNYVDSDHPGSGAVTRYGFLIEPIDATASRIGGQLLGVRNVSRKLLDVEHSALVYVFHYLIGNTDWSLVRNFEDEYCCHNGNLFQVG